MAGPKWESLATFDATPAPAPPGNGPGWESLATFENKPAAKPGTNDITRTFSDVVPEIKTTASDAASTINAGLNPVSDAQRAAHEKGASGSLLDFSGPIEGTAATGKGLAAIPALASSWLTGGAHSVLGHPLAALDDMLRAGAVKIYGEDKVAKAEAANGRQPGDSYDQAKGTVDQALMGLAPRGMSTVGPRTMPAPATTGAELKTATKAGYENPELKALQVTPDVPTNLAASIRNDLSENGARPIEGIGKRTFDLIDELEPPPGVTSVSYADIDSTRKALRKIAKERDPVTRDSTPEAVAAMRAIDKIDELPSMLRPGDVLAGDPERAAQILNETRANYAALKQSQGVEQAKNDAELSAQSSGIGGNQENRYRQTLKPFVKNPGRSAGWTPEEVAAADEIVRGSFTRDALRVVGKLGVDGGLSLLMHVGASLPSGGANIPVAIIGTLARMSGEAITAKRVNELAAMIRQRSPLAQSRPPVQEAMPGALPSAVVPQLLPQGFSLPMSFVPARARDDQDVSR